MNSLDHLFVKQEKELLIEVLILLQTELRQSDLGNKLTNELVEEKLYGLDFLMRKIEIATCFDQEDYLH